MTGYPQAFIAIDIRLANGHTLSKDTAVDIIGSIREDTNEILWTDDKGKYLVTIPTRYLRSDR